MALRDEGRAIRLVIKNYDPEVILLRDADVMLIPKEKELHTHSDTKEQLVKVEENGAEETVSFEQKSSEDEGLVPVLKFMRDKICLELAHFVPSRFDTSNLDGSSICLTQAFNSCFGTGAFSASRYLLSGGISPQFAASQGHDHHLFQALKGKGKESNFSWLNDVIRSFLCNT